MKPLYSSLVISLLLTLSAHASNNVTYELKARESIQWQPLNPARGDNSPRAGVLWGDITKDMPSGFLVKFKDGFSSPPHIHNITYRAVVLSGKVHNDDPNAAKMWMGPGSFWTQPAGEDHITAASGVDTTVFLEILEGPYLVKPSDHAFDNGERPINLESRNVVWIDASDTNWISLEATKNTDSRIHMAYLWGEPDHNKDNGSLLKLSKGTRVLISVTGSMFKSVSTQGITDYQSGVNKKTTKLDQGSYFASSNGGEHQLTCLAETSCIYYIHAKGKYTVSGR